MRRAFLSHSSEDAEFVRQVASILGPYKAHIDVKSFAPGEDFRSEIRRTLDDSDAFVFFASKASIQSLWCQFEMDEAEMRRIRRTLRRSLVISIDEEVRLEEFPEWLRRGKIVRYTGPALAARKVEGLLLAPETDRRPFLGRGEDIQRGVRKISTSEPPPRVFIASGLEGIGRRSYLDHLVSDALDLELGPFLVLSETSTLEDLFLECRTRTALLNRDELQSELKHFRGMNEEDQADETASQLAFIASQGQTPCIVDHNSMLDSSSRYTKAFQRVVDGFLNASDGLICLVHSRSPYLSGLSFGNVVLERKIKTLAKPDGRGLVTRLLSEIGVKPTVEQTERLAEEIGGYPPAAYYVVSQIEDYGIDVVLADDKRLGEFHSGSFLGYVEDLSLTELAREILVYLSFETRLPLSGISAATGSTMEEASVAVTELIDHSLVEVSNDEYVVAPPIQATMLRRKAGGLNKEWYAGAFARLEAEYWSDDNSVPPISVVDATLRAGFRIGKNRFAGYGELVRPSLLINAAQEMYHQQLYERALEYVERAQNMAPATTQLLEVKIKSLAQLHSFGPARAALREFQQFGERRKWYLDGFIDRRASNHDRACDKFQRAYAAGERSVSLLRDYADSLLRSDAPEQAFAIATEALLRDKGDIFVLNLIARIAIAVKPEADAEEALAALEAADAERRFWLQRKAWFLISRRGNAEAGRQAAKLAAEACKRRDAPMEAYVAWARALIIARDFSGVARVREQIKKKKSADGQRVVAALDCRVALQRSEWRQAEQALGRARLAPTKARSMRAEILELKAKDPSVLLEERETATREAHRLREESGVSTGSSEDLMFAE
jgi:hypothetical protein